VFAAGRGGPGSKDPAHYRFGLASLLDLIAAAYDVHFFQISSKTALDKGSFDVVANVPADQPTTWRHPEGN